MSRMPALGFSLVLFVCASCSQAESKPAADDNKGIFGKKTQEIGQFDPNKANQVVSDQKIHASDPVTGPLSAYGPLMERTSKIAVDSALGIFNAIEGRYPASHEEFMERIIKENKHPAAGIAL